MLKIKQPATIQEVFVYLWFIHTALLLSIFLYALIVFRLMPATNHAPASKSLLTVLVAFSFYDIVMGRSLRSKKINLAFQKLRDIPNDQISLDRWRQGQIIGASLAECVAIYGVLIHFVGGSNLEVAVFFVAGAIILLWWSPRKP